MKAAQESSRIAIVGAGMLGLTMALRLARAGRQVDLYESDEQVGGLARPASTGGIAFDRFGHVVMPSDLSTRALLAELGLDHRLRHARARTAIYAGGVLHGVSGVSEFVRFKPLKPVERLRMAFTVALARYIRRPERLEKQLAIDWLTRWSGESVAQKVWQPLFGCQAAGLTCAANAGNIGAMLERIGVLRSVAWRRERPGVIDGGWAIVMHALRRKLQELGVRIHTGTPVRLVRGSASGVLVTSQALGVQAYDQAVVTTTPGIAQAVCTDLRPSEKSRMETVPYRGVICVALLLRKPLSPYYFTSLTEEAPFNELIETSALAGTDAFGGHSLVHLPLYLAQDAPQWEMNATELAKACIAGLATMYPGFNEADIVTCRVSRSRQALPDSTPGYSRDVMPPVSSSVPNVRFINRAQIGSGALNINESIALADRHVEALLAVTRAAQKPTLHSGHPGEPKVTTKGFGPESVGPLTGDVADARTMRAAAEQV